MLKSLVSDFDKEKAVVGAFSRHCENSEMFVDSSSDNGDDDNISDHESGVLWACGHHRTLQILMSHSHNKICESSI